MQQGDIPNFVASAAADWAVKQAQHVNQGIE